MVELLTIAGLHAGYGEAIVLADISLSLGEGCTLALLGRNGAGKTTLINTIVGLTRHRAGTIKLAGADITPMRANQRANAGIGWVPQERSIFRSLTVEENLTSVMVRGPWTLTRIFGMFPRLAERRRNMGHQLSGGEQQMLAIGRALATNPRLLLLDEPLEGLAPVVAAELLAALRRIVRDDGLAAILVEQSPHKVLPLTDCAIILNRGVIAHVANSLDLCKDAATLGTLLGVAQQTNPKLVS